jgi:uncharacterized protein (TIGR02284 family)
MAFDPNYRETTATPETLEKSVEVLNSFLRGEISAVETYQMAATKITEPSLRSALDEILRSHQDRVNVLRTRIQQLGGRPSEGSGIWGGFAKLVEGGAKVFGARAALAALEEGEDYGLKMYREREDLEKLDPESRQLAENQLRSAQERTHGRMSGLKNSFH